VTKTRIRLPRAASAVSGAGLALLVLCAAAQAQPVGTDVRKYYPDVPDVEEEEEPEIRDVLEKANEIDLRLSKQIQLLQRQINQLQRQIEGMRADAAR
jgi:predicted PurR-regulated permease PerM